MGEPALRSYVQGQLLLPDEIFVLIEHPSLFLLIANLDSNEER